MPAIENLVNRDAGPGASITSGELTGRLVIFSVDEEMDTIGVFGSNSNTNKSLRGIGLLIIADGGQNSLVGARPQDRKDNEETR